MVMRKFRIFTVFSIISIVLCSFSYLLLYAHSGDIIYANWAVVTPTIDGIISPGEWDEAYKVRFVGTHTWSWIGHTGPHTWYGYFKLDDRYLYIAIDAVDDTGEHANDWARFLFDINHNGIMDGGWSFPRDQGDDLAWNPDWRYPSPDHARGFSSSPNSPTRHRIYEIRFPFEFNPYNGLGTSPGRTVGFASNVQDIMYCEYIWPAGAKTMEPGTWANLILSPPPVGGAILHVDNAQLLPPWIVLLTAMSLAVIMVGIKASTRRKIKNPIHIKAH